MVRKMQEGLIKTALGGPIRRTVTGAFVGAGYGYATSESNTGTGTFRDVMSGAGMGAGIATAGNLLFGGSKYIYGKATGEMSRVAGEMAASSGKMEAAGYLSGYTTSKAWGGMKLAGRGVRGAYNLTKGAAGLTANTARWAIEHPRTALGIAGTGFGAYMLSQTDDRSRVGPTVQQMGQLAMQNNISSSGFGAGMGYSPRQEDRMMFEYSTIGLVQGMHRSRH